MPVYGIVTESGDAHAAYVAALLGERKLEVSVFDTAQISSGTSYHFGAADPGTSIANTAGRVVSIDALALCWWRRCAREQNCPPLEDQPVLRQFAANGARSLVFGAFLTAFKGVFVDNPVRMMTAENKLVQLRVAQAVGMRTPKTIVTNRFESIDDFMRTERLDRAIAKPLGFAKEALVEVRAYSRDEFYPPEIEMFPTLVQEFVEGVEHLRILVLGGTVFAFSMFADAVDWRFDRPNRADYVSLPEELCERLIELVVSLGLSMGVVDMKRTHDNDYVFFEVNPQGQFLFLESIADYPLADRFCDFLVASSGIN